VGVLPKNTQVVGQITWADKYGVESRYTHQIIQGLNRGDAFDVNDRYRPAPLGPSMSLVR